MVDIEYLKELLPVLKAHKLKVYQDNGLVLEFHEEHQSMEAVAEDLKKVESQMPVDLRADNLMDHDKILNWSTAGEADEMPLAGDLPLE